MTSSVDQKKLQTTSQSQTCTKTKVMVWWSATCLTLYSFLNPRETITSEKYAQQIDALINVTTAAGIGQQKVPSSSPRPHPTARCTTNALKVEWIGLWSFASSAIVTWPLTNWLPLLQASRQLFAGKMLPQPAGGRKCFPRVCQILKHGYLHYRNKQSYFSLAKMCWL